MNHNGTKLYAGGKGLYIFEKDAKDDKVYKVLTYDGNDKKQFFGLKATPTGYIMIQEQVTNDMVVLDETGEELNRYPGAQKHIFRSRLSPSFLPVPQPALQRRTRHLTLVLRHHLHLPLQHGQCHLPRTAQFPALLRQEQRWGGHARRHERPGTDHTSLLLH